MEHESTHVGDSASQPLNLSASARGMVAVLTLGSERPLLTHFIIPHGIVVLVLTGATNNLQSISTSSAVGLAKPDSGNLRAPAIGSTMAPALAGHCCPPASHT